MEDIAVIGLGLRFPGDASSPERLWDVLAEGKSQWSEIPQDRLNIDGYYHPSGDREGSISFRGAHFLKGDVAAFDAPFFSVAAEEAKAVDPQQRILLEVSYEAIENAGLRKEDVDGSDTAVYVGSFVKDYEQICVRDPDWSPQYAATGNGIAIMANRISHFFNFHGPSMTLDTGCSGSLVSVHLAAQSLRSGESSLALAAGAALILTPATMMPMTALNFLSPDGKCFTFDSRANGYGRGEGVGVVVMKRLSDALRDNDTIRAVIRGTSVNQDGRTPGITLPSKEAQVANIRRVYANAGLDFGQTAYVECHGTGTQAGDWRELGAISETLGAGRPADKPVLVGSVKPNVGHLEGAAGVAGLIKGVMVLEHGRIPPNINFEKGNPDIDFEAWKVKVPQAVLDWPVAGVRRVSVNSFGFGGTNAHVIMDEAPVYMSERGLEGNHSSIVAATTPMPGQQGVSAESGLSGGELLHLFCYSSHDKGGVSRIIDSHLEFLHDAEEDRGTQEYLRDYAYTLNCRRSGLEWKAFILARSLADLGSKSQSLDPATIVRSSREKTPRVGFLFCGQGSQWAQMGKGLMPLEPFRASIEQASRYLHDKLLSPFNLLEELLRPEAESAIGEPHISQPATTALQVALVDLMATLGVTPTSVVGHSSGEIAAAYAKGALSREEAWEVAYYRGLTAASIPWRAPKLKGRMMVVGMSQDETAKYLRSVNKSAQIACINSPRSITISGQEEAIEFIDADLREKKVFCRVLSVKTAYHSSHMKLVEHDYKALLAHMSPRQGRSSVRMFSSVSGSEVDGSHLDAAYWAANMVFPVQYVAAVEAMMAAPEEERPGVLIELSPRAALRSPTADILSSDGPSSTQPSYYSVLDPRQDASTLFLGLIGGLWSRGCDIDMAKVTGLVSGGSRAKCLSELPPYPWNHKRSYWHESHQSLSVRFREHPRQDLIGALTVDSTPFEPRWRGFLRVSENPWIQDHQVQKTIVYPAAGMISMVLEGAKQIGRNVPQLLGYEITGMQIDRAMIVPNTAYGLEVMLVIKSPHRESADGFSLDKNDFSIYSMHQGREWERNATGSLYFRQRSHGREAAFRTQAARHEALEGSCKETLNPRQLYEFLDTVGMNYGPLFQNMTEIRRDSGLGACVSTVRVPDTRSKMPARFEYPHLLHPATLDAMFQTLFAVDSSPMVPTSIASIFVSADAGAAPTDVPFRGYAEARRSGIRDADATIVMSRHGGESMSRTEHVIIEGLHMTGLSSPSPAEGGFLPNHRNLCTEILWAEDAAFAKPTSFAECVRLFAHKCPALAVLQVGGGISAAAAVVECLRPQDDETPRLARFTALDPDTDVSSQILAQVRGTTLEPFVELHPDGSGLFADYDLIVVLDSAVVEDETLRTRLKPGGVLLRHGAGVDQAELSFEPSSGPALPLTSYRKAYKATDGQDVVVLVPQCPDQDVATLSDTVQGLVKQACPGIEVTSMSINDLEKESTSLGGKIVVSLLDFAGASASENYSVFAWTEPDFDAFRTLQRTAKGIVWLTRGAHMTPLNPRGAPIIALARTLMSEDPLKTIVTLDLDEASRLTDPAVGQAVLRVLRQTFHVKHGAEPRETEYAEKDGRLYIPRLAPVWGLNRLVEDEHLHGGFLQLPFVPEEDVVEQQHQGLRLTIAKPGLTDGSLYYTELEHPELGDDDVEISYEKASLTHLDLDTVMGRTVDDTLGVDVVGRVKRIGANITHVRVGELVAALAPGGTIQSTVCTKGSLVAGYTPGFSPALHVSAYYGIVHLGRAGPGRKVLVHAGASAYGLAAVQMAVSVGADVYATVLGAEASQQREALVAHGLPEERVLDADSDGFVHGVLAASGGKGFDVVYNPTQAHIEASSKCVRKCGTIVQFASRSAAARALPAAPGGSATIVSFDLGQLMREDADFVAELFDKTAPRIQRETFDASRRQSNIDHVLEVGQLPAALDKIQATPYLGHITLTAGGTVPVINTSPTKPLSACLDPERTYLLAGGLGGLGRSISDLLVANGARHLAYLSRGGASSATAREYLASLRARGVDARAYAVDICDADALTATLGETLAVEMPPVGGVFQCAAVLRDAVFDNMTWEDWDAAIKPKALGSWNLVQAIEATAVVAPHAQDGETQYQHGGDDGDGDNSSGRPFFVFLASSAGVIGNRGQANYAAGNAFKDALARNLRLRGRHAVALDLGPVLGAGMLAEDEAVLDILRASGFYGIRHGDFLKLVAHAITGETTTTGIPGAASSPIPPQVTLGVGTGGIIRQNQPADPYWSRTALYRYLNLVDVPAAPDGLSQAAAGSAASSSSSGDLKALLACCESVGAAADVVQRGLMGMLAKAMNMLPEEVDAGKPPNAYGVDSLVAVGVRNFVISSFGVQVSVFEILSDGTIAELSLMIVQKGGYGRA
ncbi:Type I Iterative PKS [Purpureocillium takamizusanense]|uniref:Type I Iterative PKS n=1 Tax=Purpureocillium takamizusanense TaxID=2060973 RepID=A0A9Q8QRR0_9HYPO|nr:Type I Iterative PKS [Purpureocillium takamizusanense]UNI24086.1 Type I Iterative PKS [Purpureocillium takamizusanense]